MMYATKAKAVPPDSGTARKQTHIFFSTIGLETNSDNIALPTFWPTVLYYSAKTGLSLYIKAVLA